MANSSAVGFGLRPIRKVGQNDDNNGLSEYSPKPALLSFCAIFLMGLNPNPTVDAFAIVFLLM